MAKKMIFRYKKAGCFSVLPLTALLNFGYGVKIQINSETPRTCIRFKPAGGAL